MIRLKEREKKFIIAGTLIVAVSLLYVFIVNPLIINISALKKDFIEKQKLIENLDKEKKSVTLLMQKVEREADKLETVYAGIPQGKNVHEIIVDLETFVTDNRLKLHTFTVLDLEDNETYYKLPIKIRVSGQFNDIIVFLRGWEGYKRLVNISEVRMSLDKEKNIIITELLANIYILESEEGFIENLHLNIINGEKGRSNPFSPLH